MNKFLSALFLSLFAAPAFMLAQQPVISSVSSLSAYPGSSVVISGTGFDGTTAGNIVYFGATKAVVATASATDLTVTVPVGASFSQVSVVNNVSGLIGYAQYPFLPAYDNSPYDPTATLFEPHVDFSGVTNPSRVVIGDLDRDGKADVVVANAGAATISVFRNISISGAISAGSLDAAVTYSVPQPVQDITLADIDGDGKLDIVAANSGAVLSFVSVLRNTTAGVGTFSAASFAASVDLAANAGAQGVTAADMDMDGKTDLLVACSSNVLNTFRNIGTAGSLTTGSFAPKDNITPGTAPVKVLAGDIDGDTKPDMVVINSGSGNVSVFRNTMTAPGPIVTASFAAIVNLTAGTNPVAGALADIDGDGKQEICIANSGSNTIAVFRNTSVSGTITSGTLSPRVDFAVGTTPRGIAVADFNGDGKPDLVSCNNGTDNISLLKNTAVSGTIDAASFSTALSFAAGSGPARVAAGDIDGDGKPEILVSNATAATVSVLRNNPLAAITGTFNVCVGATTTMSNATVGGTWSTSATSIATINATTGVLSGVSTGTTTVSYTVSGVSATAIVTVSPVPDAGTLSGTDTVCPGSTTLISSTVSGGTWASSNVAIGTVDAATGTVTGIASGTTTISYTAATGCGTATATMVVTVNTLSDPGTVSGAAGICAGSMVTLSSTVSGGTWISGGPEATVDAGTGEVTGVSGGTVLISYETTNVCGSSYATAIVTVQALPDITGAASVCSGSSVTLSSSVAGGTWQSGNTSLATVGTSGVVTGVTAGVVVITYTAGGCENTIVMTVDITPSAGTISGISSPFCAGTTGTFTATVAGGSWSSSDAAVATVGTDGVVTGVDAGTAVISYSFTNSCATVAATSVVTVDTLLDPGVISGPVSVCASGSTISLTNTVSIGTWSSSNATAATVSSAGVVTGIDPGTTTISYSVSNSCGDMHALHSVTVNALPDTISGPSTVCVNATVTLSSLTGGGMWTATGTAVTIDAATGAVTGVNAGTTIVSYTLVVGCFRTKALTVNSLPIPIGGVLSVCEGGNSALIGSVGGTWSSADEFIATVGSSTGITTGIAAGTVGVTYTKTSTGCIRTAIITVNPAPGTITGDFVICAGTRDTFMCTPAGGTWSSSNPVVATVIMHTGEVRGAIVGTTNITYTTAAGCRTWQTITINQSPSNISGSLEVCEGSTSFLTNSVSFGVWVSSNTAVGVISASGLVAGVAPGTSVVSYVLGNGCYRSAIVTVNPLPTGTTGPHQVCTGNTVTLSGIPAGGTWSSSNLTRAGVGFTTGVVTGVSAGTAAISYILPTGCKIPHLVTVNPSPSSIAGTLSVCEGTTTMLSSSPAAGTWVSSNVAIATVGSAAGIVTGVAAGSVAISYIIPATGCLSSDTVTVNPTPAVVFGALTVCPGSSTLLTTTAAGGTWTSSAPAIATVGSLTGNVTGVVSGTTAITYRSPVGCSRVAVVTVNTLAAAGTVLGTPTVCEGASVTLVATVPGGVWSAVTGATSVSATGDVSGIMAGVDTIKYTVTGICNADIATYVVTVNALPDMGTLTGSDTACVGYTSSVASSVVGGSWSSSNTAVATIAGGTITGVAAGSTTISYSGTNACGTRAATLDVEIIPAADAGTIVGADTVCYGNSVTLSSPVAGGTWSSTSLFVSVNEETGSVTGLAPGNAVIRYIVRNECSVDTSFYTIYVKYSVDCPTAVLPVTTSAHYFRVYPVPVTTGSVNLETSVAGYFSLYTVDGKEVVTQLVKSGHNVIDLSSLHLTGFCIGRFKGNDGTVEQVKILLDN